MTRIQQRAHVTTRRSSTKHLRHQVPVTVHREQSMKREDQQDATIRCLLLTSVSTCFGPHYANLQENKGPVTAFGVLFWFCWMWLVAVVGCCVVGCEQCSKHVETEVNNKHLIVASCWSSLFIFKAC